jgi:hypothetical protein
VNIDDPLVAHVVRNSFVMRLATMSAAGHASITPLWFVIDDGRLIADPRVAVLLDGERAGHSDLVLRLRGVAAANEGMPPRSAMIRLAVKYYLSPGGLGCELRHIRRWRLRQRYYAQADAIWIAIEPTAAEFLALPTADRGADHAAINPAVATRRD